ncbi:MAG: hypothetical protein ABI243_06740 [Lapillicoccus sp.]
MTTALHDPTDRGASTVTGGPVTGQSVIDGALLLPRAVVATHALLTGAGVATYRATFPRHGRGGRAQGRAVTTSSPSRVATHVVTGGVLALLALAVVAGLVLALLASPLLLAPAGGASLVAFAGIGAGHARLTRRLIDRA